MTVVWLFVIDYRFSINAFSPLQMINALDGHFGIKWTEMEPKPVWHKFVKVDWTNIGANKNARLSLLIFLVFVYIFI